MKNKLVKLGLLSTLLLGGMQLSTANSNIEVERVMHDDLVTKTFKVFGNCGMCEKTIEGSLQSVKGIEKADWNKDTKMMEVSFHEHDITLAEIKKKIASVGYDTDETKATDESYNNLPGCCQYDRE